MDIYTLIKPHKLREVFFVLVALVFCFAHTQNKTETTYNTSSVKKIVIDGNQIFTIDVSVAETDLVTVTSATDGEYQNDFKVISQLKGNTLHLALQRATLTVAPDDKRNAHKVIAATLQIELPRSKSITINSDIGSAHLKGDFDTILVQLNQGDFSIYGTAKTLNVKTIGGNINATTKDALIETDSHKGLVDIPNDLFGFNVWKLKTNSGNITVKKIDF